MASFAGLLFIVLAVICGAACSSSGKLMTQVCNAEKDLSTFCPLTSVINEDDYECFQSTREECDGTTFLGDGSFCELIEDPSQIYQCRTGQWTLSDPGPVKHPHKRWFFVAFVIAVVCIIWCRGGPSTPPNNPPHFNYCPSDIEVTASSGSTRATATWAQPSATDPGDSSPTVRQERGPSSGGTFDEGNTFISYRAWDSQGLSAYCYFTVRVKVVYCSYPTTLVRGIQTCSGDKTNIAGSVCRHTCHLGYELSGSPTVECRRTNSGNTGIWNTAFPTCKPVSCGDPGSVAGGGFQCPSGHTYAEMCFVTCNPGYRYTGSAYVSCTAARSWTKAYPCTDVEPPKFTSGCPARQDLYARPLETPVAVTWSDPVTTDNSGGVVTLTSDLAKGTLLGPGVKVVLLTATDAAGNSVSCSFLVTVKARECPALSPPYHGKVTCSHRFVEGSQCTVTCEEGYRPLMNDTLTCLVSETWDLPVPTCEAVLCPEPPNVDHGDFACLRGRQFPEGCNLVCDSGFVARPPYGIQCLANATWTQPGDCQDIVSPEFPNGCPANIDSYAASLGVPTLIKWTPPVVTDNSGQTVQMTSDVPSNSAFPVGVTRVTYTATDVTGNNRSCQFKVTINTLQCSAPDFEPANRTQTLMTYTCPSGLVHGATCTLACLQGYPLVGPSNITCERDDTTHPPTMFWDWPGPSGNTPQCAVSVCPNLAAPVHGALACNLGNFGWDCLMSCQNGWDVPAQVNNGGHFYCTNSNGFWIPAAAPGCTAKLRPFDVKLMADIFYYTGSCNASLFDELRANFVIRMNYSTFKDACVGSCFVDNIQVTCGSVRRKKDTEHIFNRGHYISKRAAQSIIIITFEILLSNASDQSYQDVTQMKDSIATALSIDASNGLFNIGDLQADEYSFSVPKIGAQCPPGSLYIERDFTPSLSCTGCGAGYYLSVGSKECQPCPVGNYTDLDSATTCTPCPPGWTTLFTGSTNITECKELCAPGTFSYNGFVPCQPCSPGSYQARDSTTSCDFCPAGTWTEGGSATSVTQCHPADVSVSNSSLTVSVKEGQYSSGLTIAVWVKPLQAVDVNVSFQSISTLTTPAKGKWSHVLVTVNLNGHTTVALQNSEVFSGNMHQGLSVISPNTFQLGVPEGTVLVGGFSAWDKVLPEEERAAASLTCTGNTASNILTWSPPPSTVQLPSVCDAVDECEGSPCGTQPCDNQVGGFVCHCQAGWTGVTCNTPPDPCLKHLCRHGATCLSDGASNYTCACPAGYTGDLCDLIAVAGGWGGWATWGECSASCGEGVRSRQRLCDNPAPRYGGEDCNGSDTDTQGCTVVLCVAGNVTWGEWGQWSVCSVTCGGGKRTRQRSCTEGDKQNASGCVGVHEEEEVCSTFSCPVHGGWSEWSDRSPCSVTCGVGQKSRERTCTNPSPANGGNSCSGDAIGNSTCNLAACPVCATLRRSLGTVLSCEQLESPYLRVCNLTCASGYASPSEPFPQYRCGEETNFIWSHQVDGQSDAALPNCDIPSFPSNATLTQNVTMNTGCDPGTASGVQSGVASNIEAAVPCSISSDCHTQLTTSCSSSGTNRKKRETGFLIVHLTMTLDFSAFLNAGANDTNTARAFLELLQLGEKSAAMVAMNDTGNLFTVNIAGVEIKPDLSSVTYTADLSCPTGTIPKNGFCLSCPSGYKEASRECVPCPLGQYQDQPASTVCKDCPGDTTWHLLGAVSITQCIVPLSTAHGPVENDDTSLPHTTVVAIAVTVCVTVVLLAVVAAVAAVATHRSQRPPSSQDKRRNTKVCPSPPRPVHSLYVSTTPPPPYNEAMDLKPVLLAWEKPTVGVPPSATSVLQHPLPATATATPSPPPNHLDEKREQ